MKRITLRNTEREQPFQLKSHIMITPRLTLLMTMIMIAKMTMKKK